MLRSISFSIGNKGYFGTGFNGIVVKDFWEYNPTNNTWTQKADFGGLSRDNSVAFSIGEKGYVGTGDNNAGGLFRDFWEYNPSTNSWTQKADFGGTARGVAVGFSIGDKGYIGTGNDFTYTKDFWEYNPILDVWTRKADFPGVVRGCASCFSIGNKGYLGIGNIGGVSYNDFWEYNQETDAWTRKADFAGGNSSYNVGFSIAKKGYFGIGFQSSGMVTNLYEYDPTIDTWTNKSNFPGSPRLVASSFNIGYKGYVGLGNDNISITFQDFWEYTPGTTPSIDNTNVIKFTNHMATSSASISFDGNYSVEQKGFAWSTSSNPTLASHPNGGFTSKGTGNSSYLDTLNNLLPNTLYYFRAYASNSQGTSYGDEYSFTTLSNEAQIENNAPNIGDGNGDGIADSQQNEVYSILNTYTNKYITIVSLDGYAISGAEVQLQNDITNYYPANLVKFTIAHSNARVKIIYHGITSLTEYSFKKLNSQNILFNFTKCTFGNEVIDGKTVATATLTLTDGGPEDYDGVVNGSITDPGGPAILASDANIPVWDWRYLSLLVVLFGIGNFKINKMKFSKA
ncbi:MAG: hypothetical protein NTW25_14785 [Candidatus Kapabacteria bacterium]|nr:hypothetical protein [Candidatus Kapabacteria bacterium]